MRSASIVRKSIRRLMFVMLAMCLNMISLSLYNVGMLAYDSIFHVALNCIRFIYYAIVAAVVNLQLAALVLCTISFEAI